jgi:hypothetical protein
MFSLAFKSIFPSPAFTSDSSSAFSATFFVFAFDVRENLSAVVRFTQKFTIYFEKIYPAKRMKIPVVTVMKSDDVIRIYLFLYVASPIGLYKSVVFAKLSYAKTHKKASKLNKKL